MSVPNIRRIWVVNYAGHNMAAALEHSICGTDECFRYMTSGSVNIFETDRVSHLFNKMIEDFDSKQDALLLSGSSVLNIIAVLAAVRRYGEVTVLIWHAKGREYVRRTIR